MSTRLPLFAGLSLAAVCLAFPAASARAPQDASPDLKKRVDQLEEVVLRQHDELEKLKKTHTALLSACEGLDKAADSSRANGFEWAAPNPQSKTDLLDGIKAFAAAVKKSVAKEPDPKDG